MWCWSASLARTSPAFEQVAARWSLTIDQAMHDAARDFQAAFILAQLDPLRALPVLRVPGTGRQPELNERQLHARRRVHEMMAALGGISSPAGSCR